MAIGKVVIRQKENLVALRPMDGDVLGMTTMIFADEVVDPSALDELEALDDVEAGERELKMAQQLIESLSADFEPEKYHDEYRERVLELIERKAAGEEIAVQPVEEPAPVPDLMAALEASIAAAKKGGDESEKPARSKAPANGGRAKKSAPTARGPRARAAAARRPRRRSRLRPAAGAPFGACPARLTTTTLRARPLACGPV